MQQCCRLKTGARNLNRFMVLDSCTCIFVLMSMVQMRQELEKIRHRLEAELSETREQLAEKTSQLDELQTLMNRREEELQQTLNK